ncbi:MAG: TraB/GumN family protein [Chitinophagaceae bacterium]|nr:TraB/GumN family protein [Chitinophagaceae bacterium]
MTRSLLLLVVICPYLLQAQPKIKDKKYPSLLWEITGKGLKKPSYLFGTMHVSNKLAFQLADSFYIGIRNADVVALETNPESWQEDMSKYKAEEQQGGGYGDYVYRGGGYTPVPDDYLSINTLKFYKYDKNIERSLYSSPSTINNLLYRTYGNDASDFEEDTYLDMYIYQCGKKWGKKVAGVERYDESMKLMAEAYKDAAKDKNRKERSDREEGYAPDKIQEAYRTGNLDLLDSINKYNSFSEAFDEKFLYKRNEIQAESIDSILKRNVSLFVGVGAAHLPGKRGVIEMLREMGYRLRPIKMGERDSQHKNSVEKIRVPVIFETQTTEDGFFSVDIPGKFYKFGEAGSLDQRQYADMANGSYYMVTRVMTNAWMWGHTEQDVYNTIDSLLYENIPGKIITKTKMTRNGFNGFAITNKTRRGDVQRYNIFITPFEILFFKMSGTGDYVKNGEEANRFFNSIHFKEYKPAMEGWHKYSPASGGFSVSLPHDPYMGNDGSWIYDAHDKTANAKYRVMRSDVHNYGFVEEDTFDLGLMQESFAASEFIDTLLSRRQFVYKGYPALECKFQDKKKSIYLTRFLIQGPHYYALIAHGKTDSPKMQAFFNSFEIKPFIYGDAKPRKDTSLYYAVKSPVFPDDSKDKLAVPGYSYHGYGEDDEESEADLLESGTFRSRVISNDTTGEKIHISFFKTHPYFTNKDSTNLDDQSLGRFGDSTRIFRMKKKHTMPDGMKVWETIVSDTGSSRALWSKTYYKSGIGYSLITQIDTLSKPGSFVQTFFDSFDPADTLKGSDPFTKKTALFLSDLLSTDSIRQKRARRGIALVNIDSADFPGVKSAIGTLNWTEKKYLDTKKQLISKLAEVKTKITSDYLKDLYYAVGDTVELQYTILETLLRQKTKYSFIVFRDIVTVEPPVMDVSSNDGYRDYGVPAYVQAFRNTSDYSDGNFLDELYDSLQLTRTILPELLPLLNLDDYERPMMKLLGRMVDSNLVRPLDYQPYFSKFLIEARQEMKKQGIAEKNRAIKKAEEEKEDRQNRFAGNNEKDMGNEGLSLYATLLLPYSETNPAVGTVLQQMLKSNDNRLKYRTTILLLRHGRPIPDSMLAHFAKLDEYRYEFYNDLVDMKMKSKFPALHNNHIDLGKSKLLEERTYEKPDSLVYVDRLPTTVKGHKGFVYFFKYKTKKDDISWKLATVGLVPEDPSTFEFSNIEKPSFTGYNQWGNHMADHYRFDFTSFTDTRIKEDESIGEQMQKALKKLLYSKRNSSREFFEKEGRGGYDITRSVDIDD